jgi:hypothetical protein
VPRLPAAPVISATFPEKFDVFMRDLNAPY